MKRFKTIATCTFATVLGAGSAMAGGGGPPHLTIVAHGLEGGFGQHSTRVLSQTYDDSGMSGDSGSALASNDTHTGEAGLVGSTMGLFQGQHPGWLEYDLGQSFALSNLVVWNYNEPVWFAQGMKEVTIEVRELGGPSTTVFSPSIDGPMPASPAMGTTNTTAAVDLDLTGQVARFIRFTSGVPNEHNRSFETFGLDNDSSVGLSEVRVYGDPTGLGNTNTAEACCFADGSCQQLEAGDCTAQGGTSQGVGTECVNFQCPQPTEACCFDDGICTDEDPLICASQGGIPGGIGTDCGTFGCPQPEACCFNDGTCQDLLTNLCVAASGVPRGGFTTCASEVCPQQEACCLPDETCQDLLTDLCMAMGGTPQGTHSTCSFATCVTSTVVVATNVVGVGIDDNLGTTYNIERATSLNPDWADADPSFHAGDGASATLVSDRADPNALYRFGSDALPAAVGNPNGGNGWDTTSEVRARANTERTVAGNPRLLIATINGSGMDANGLGHRATDTTEHFLAQQPGSVDQGPERFTNVTDWVWVEFDLGSPQDISDMLIWNYGERAANPEWSAQGAKDVEIFYTTVGGGAALPTSTSPDADWGSDDINDWIQIGGSGNVISLNWASSNFVDSAGLIQVTDAIAIDDTAEYVLMLGAMPPDHSHQFDLLGTINGDVALSEVRFVLENQPPPPDIQAVDIGDQTCLSFATASNTVYELQRAAKFFVLSNAVGDPQPANGCSTTSEVTVVEHNGEAGGRFAITSINGVGVVGDLCDMHTGGNPTLPAPDGQMWMGRNDAPGNPGANGVAQNPGQTPGSHYITYGFDAPHDITECWIWNWNETGWPCFGWQFLEIQVSTTGGTNVSDWTTVHTGVLPVGTGANPAPASAKIDLGGVSAQWVALINTGFAPDEHYCSTVIPGSTYVDSAGLSEVRFLEAGTTIVPIPLEEAVFKNSGARTTGDGSTQVLYDPNGYDDATWYYRVVPK